MTFLARNLSFLWRLPGRPAARLREFALAEDGSLRDLRLAARLTPSATRAALYLSHAADEARHARMFARHANDWERREETGDAGSPVLEADIEDLYEQLGEVKFLAFVHRGERRGRMQFEAYRDHFRKRGAKKTAELFETIIQDERRHESYSLALLEELAGSPQETKRALAWVRRWELWRRFRRLGRGPADLLYNLLMRLTYLLAFPVALWLRWVDPAHAGYRDPQTDRD